jgi:uncharacterized protein (TIGR02147 family)
MDKQPKINVYNYTNFRDLLKDYYEIGKKSNPSFSYRSFLKKAGIAAVGIYHDIVNSRNNLSKTLVFKFARAMGMNRNETEYFENMVNFNQAKSVEDKNLYFERMMRFYASKAYKVESSQYAFYSKWYYSAIRELLAIGDFNDDPALIAKSLSPSIRPHEAKKALDVLMKIRLIKKSTRGYYKPQNAVITTGPEVKSLNVANFQREMMGLAKEAIDRFPAKHRNISTLTININKADYPAIEAEIVGCRKKILAMAERSQEPDRVYQVNFQMFPLVKIKESL